MIEDSPIDSAHFKMLVESLPDVGVVVAESLYTAHSVGSCDVIFLDLMLAPACEDDEGSLGVETVLKCRKAFPDKPIVVLTHVDDPEIQARCMQAGADWFLRKGAQNADEMLKSAEAAIVSHHLKLASVGEIAATASYFNKASRMLAALSEQMGKMQERLTHLGVETVEE